MTAFASLDCFSRLPRFDKSYETSMFSFAHPLYPSRSPALISASCLKPLAQNVLYPSEDVEEQLFLLSVYPEPAAADGSASDGPDGAGAGPAGPADPAAPPQDQSSPGEAGTAVTTEGGGGGGGLQEKTDEVLKSITGSNATVADILGGRPPGGGGGGGTNSAAAGAGSAEAAASKQDRFGDGANGGGGGGGGGANSGRDLFKPPSMAEMKRRLEDITAGTAGQSPLPAQGPADLGWAGARTRQRPGRRRPERPKNGRSVRVPGPAGQRRRGRRVPGQVRRGVARLPPPQRRGGGGGRHQAQDRLQGQGQGRGGQGEKRPRRRRFCWRRRCGRGGGGRSALEAVRRRGGDDGTPVPLPTAEEVRRGRAAERGRSALAARKELDGWYGGGDGCM